MTPRARFVVRVLMWTCPIAWTVAWGLFRGERAHGGYVWWFNAQMGVLVPLVVLCLFARTYLWRRSASVPRALAPHAAQQGAFVAVIIIASWLSFQTGYARHEPPQTLSEFLWSDP